MQHQAQEFSSAGYAALLDAYAQAGYVCVGFEDIKATPKTLTMRHDIDFDLSQARAMAAIEKSKGIRATYFFLLRTEMYNLFSASGTAMVKDIIAMGHDIGIHFDARAYEAQDAGALREAIHQEMDILGRWLGVGCRALSFHRPAPALLDDIEGALTSPYVHAYQSCFSKDRQYLSDSQGAWRYGHPLESDAFKAGAAMQVLVHPIWWQNAQAPYTTLENFVQSRTDMLAAQTAQHCKVFRQGRFADVKD